MPYFSDKSKEQLATCDKRLQKLFNFVIQHWDCSVLQGFRNEDDQNAAFKSGYSHLKWPLSKHNIETDGYPCSLAVDVVPYPIHWDDKDRFYCFAGFVMGVAAAMDIPLTWGGDWNGDRNLKNQKLYDLPHFQIDT